MAEMTKKKCTAITRAGVGCKNIALDGGEFCSIHRPVKATMNGAGAAAQVAAEPAGDTIPVEEEPTPEALQGRLRAEFAALIERLRGLGDRLPPELREQLGGIINEDLLDPETWKGLWFMIDYNVRYQLDLVKRRVTGEYETDEWGLDWEILEAVRPFLSFMYRYYWRVTTSGLENVPDWGRALLVSNHSGQLPWDGAMIMTAILSEHQAQRLTRNLYGDWFPTLPFFSSLFEKTGQVMATVENGTRLLEQDELVCVFPEGYKGVGKLFRDRYHLAPFGHGGFIKMALRTGTPIIPVAVVGAEETYISLAKSPALARLTGLPYFPISPRFPWLGPLGMVPLPTKWYIDIGEPMAMDVYEPDAADDALLVGRLTEQVRRQVQRMLQKRLNERKDWFRG